MRVNYIYFTIYIMHNAFSYLFDKKIIIYNNFNLKVNYGN
jgi:hypothetical protein